MATISRWGTPTSAVILINCATFDNLAQAARKISATVSNNTDRYFYADFRLNLSATTANRCAGAHCRMFILPDLGGDSSYSYGSSSLAPSPNRWVGNFVYDSGATAARIAHLTHVLLPMGNFQVILENRLGRLFSSQTRLVMKRYHVISS